LRGFAFYMIPNESPMFFVAGVDDVSAAVKALFSDELTEQEILEIYDVRDEVDDRIRWEGVYTRGRHTRWAQIATV